MGKSGRTIPENRIYRHREPTCGGELSLKPGFDGWVLVCEACGSEWACEFRRVTPSTDGPDEREDIGQLELPMEVPIEHEPTPEHLDRLATDDLEESFVQQWKKLNEGDDGYLHAILRRDWKRIPVSRWPASYYVVDQRVAVAVASAMQWLGTNCGFAFLRTALEEVGWTIREAPGRPPHTYKCRWCQAMKPAKVIRAKGDLWTPPYPYLRYHPTVEGSPYCEGTLERIEAYRKEQRELAEAEQAMEALRRACEPVGKGARK